MRKNGFSGRGFTSTGMVELVKKRRRVIIYPLGGATSNMLGEMGIEGVKIIRDRRVLGPDFRKKKKVSTLRADLLGKA